MGWALCGGASKGDAAQVEALEFLLLLRIAVENRHRHGHGHGREHGVEWSSTFRCIIDYDSDCSVPLTSG